MDNKFYDTLEITDLKDMLNKTRKMYDEKIAYKIKIEEGKYKTITHNEVRNMIDSLGTALINLGLRCRFRRCISFYFTNTPCF